MKKKKQKYAVHFPQVNAMWIRVDAESPDDAMQKACNKWREKPMPDYVELDKQSTC